MYINELKLKKKSKMNTIKCDIYNTIKHKNNSFMYN